MPRSIILSNAILLLCLSALAGVGLPVVLGGAHPLATQTCIVWVFASIAVVTGIIMLVTELLSGHRLIALGAWWTYCNGLGSALAEWAWVTGLVAVVLWFAVLASAARANR